MTENEVSFGDLPVYEAAELALDSLELLTAAVAELRERMASHQLDPQARVELAVEIRQTAAQLQAFAMLVLA